MSRWDWIDRELTVVDPRFARGRLRACVAALFASEGRQTYSLRLDVVGCKLNGVRSRRCPESPTVQPVQLRRAPHPGSD